MNFQNSVFKLNSNVLALVLLTFYSFSTPNLSAQSGNDTIMPFGQVVPFDLNGGTANNFPFVDAYPAGDINGDGYGDFMFNLRSADERTADPADVLFKSALVTDINHPDSCQIFYGCRLESIGDYDGDGYDDVLDIEDKSILFGTVTGLTQTGLSIEYSFDRPIVYFKGDLNNDGRSEFIVGNESYADTLLVFSSNESIPEILKIYITYCSPSYDESSFYIYDYDSDGQDELCVTLFDHFDPIRYFSYYTLNPEQHKMDLEKRVQSSYINEPAYCFSSSFCDLNGDGNIDFAHTYYCGADKMCIEACFGQDEEPYFSDPVDLNTLNPSRILYCAGDLNNDGFDDWYSKSDPDTIVLYLGNANIAEQGFNVEKYFCGDHQFLYPQCMSWNDRIYDLITKTEIFYYNDDDIPDIFFNYMSVDNKLRFDSVGTGIVLGGNAPDFSNPLVLGRNADDSYCELQYGSRTKALGDLNGDGLEDWGTLARKACYAEIFYGDSYIHSIPDIRIMLPQVNLAECWDWTSGDLNGDGHIDLVISNSSDRDVGVVPSLTREEESIYIFFGSSDWPSELYYDDADIVLHDSANFYAFGENISIVGDYNADGFNDLVIGGYQRHFKKEAFVYFGGEEIGPYPDLDIKESNNGLCFEFADPITACGDINADGYDDFTLGDPDNSDNQGQCLIYFGGPDADSLYDMVLSNPQGSKYYFGDKTPEKPGDFDGDGYPDLVQASCYPTDGIYVYRGGPEFDDKYDYILTDTNINFTNAYIYYIKDFSENGKSDIALSDFRSWKTYVFSDTDTLNENADFILKSPEGGISCIEGYDMDYDGYAELLAGIPSEPNYGTPHGGIISFYRSPVHVGIKDHQSPMTSGISVYPVPASDFIHVNLIPKETGAIHAELIDLQGKVIRNYNYSGKKGEQTILNLSVSGVSPGFYILRMNSGGVVKEKKVVIDG